MGQGWATGERRPAGVGQSHQGGVGGVHAGAKTETDRPVLQGSLKGAGIELASALVDGRGEQTRGPCLTRRIIGAAQGEAYVESDHRIAVILDQPGLDPARAGHGGDVIAWAGPLTASSVSRPKAARPSGEWEMGH